MKSIFLALALMFTVQANATSLYPGRSLTLTDVKLDGEETNLTAVINLDFVQNTMQVDLFEDPCGQLRPVVPGMMRCMAAAVLQESHTVPLVKATTSCGSKIFLGEEDQTPVDGLKVSVQLADHAARICNDHIMHIVQAKMTVEAVRTQTKRVFEMSK
jgi:hypothetical protein